MHPAQKSALKVCIDLAGCIGSIDSPTFAFFGSFSEINPPVAV